MRFHHGASDTYILSYTADIDWFSATVLGYFVEGQLRGIAELIPRDHIWPITAELALSVDGPFQNRGIGTDLSRHVLVMASNRLIGAVYMSCLFENGKMLRVARKLGASLVVRDGLAEGEIFPPGPSYVSFIQEVAAESRALYCAAWQARPQDAPAIGAPGAWIQRGPPG